MVCMLMKLNQEKSRVKKYDYETENWNYSKFIEHPRGPNEPTDDVTFADWQNKKCSTHQNVIE